MKTLVLSRAETEAVLHVRDIEALGHRHNERSCPAGTRTMCRHSESLRSAVPKFNRARVLTADRHEVFRGRDGLFYVSARPVQEPRSRSKAW